MAKERREERRPALSLLLYLKLTLCSLEGGFCFLFCALRRRGQGGGCGDAVKVLREIIACIKIFTPVEGLKPFPWALNSD